jgi:ATPase family AAA domain-containing protein 1
VQRILPHVVLPEEIAVSMADVGGLEDVRSEIEHIFLTDQTGAAALLAARSPLLSPPKGVLFYGPPGTGKTLVAKAIAKECAATFINVPFSALTDKFYGESHKLIGALFSVARKLAPSIIFIDEMHALHGTTTPPPAPPSLPPAIMLPQRH